ncbi:MAG: VWA domain-containing protein [Thermoanaerobaculaceae bacterium]|nr:VWA domain-containing protein [Thermoanaerobaculaceae bacterium]
MGTKTTAVVRAVVALVAVGTAAAQRPAAPAKPVTEAVQVNVVNVEVFAADRDGVPVLDLTPGEFELREDGRVVPLSNFLAPGAARLAGGAVEAASDGTPAAPLGDDAQRVMVVFADDLNLTYMGRKRALDRLGEYLDGRVRDGWRVLVVSYDRSLHALTPLTRDPALVAAAMAALQHTTTEGSMLGLQKQKLLRDMGRPIAGEGGDAGDLMRESLLRETEMFAEEQLRLNKSLLESLGRFVDSLAGLPGRKALLFLSDGVQSRVCDELFREYQARFPGKSEFIGTMSRYSLSLALQEVTRRANASGVTFYTINARPEMGAGQGTAEDAVPNQEAVDTIEAMSRDESMTGFAAGTGGLRLANTRALSDALQRITADIEGAYLLGYTPSHFGDGRYHKLSVRSTRAGVSVRCREGYLDKTPAERQGDRAAAALVAGGNANPLSATVALGEPEKQGRNTLAVPLTVYVPAAALTLLDTGGASEGKVSVTIVVAKANGATSQAHRETFPIKVPSQHLAAFRTQRTEFTFSLLLQPGDRSVSVTARDEVGQVESVVVTDLDVEPEKR